ncbi:hypothetical protein [Haloarchaeobius sp. HRN-SO-5]|uniref:DUF7847 domain-containing protein n=1 Tax=Haloarchaeobius sp. HRN-SO-5 TaxID=3446118 RepID=UPI003EB7B952
MSLLAAIEKTGDTLRRNPVLFVPVVFVVLLLVPQLALRPTSPGLANLFALVVSLAFVFLLPFVQGGLTGMANEALDADTSLTTFFEEGKRNYVSLFAVFLGVVTVNVTVGLFVLFVVLIALVANYPGGAAGSSALTPALLVILLGMLVVPALVFLLLVLFTQFYSQAIVIDDLRAFDSIKRSVALVRANLASVGSYSVVVGSLGVLLSFLFGLSVVVTSNATGDLTSPTSSTALVAAVVGFGTLSGGVYTTLSVAFYRTLDGAR